MPECDRVVPQFMPMGDVRYWHIADIPPAPTNVCFQGVKRTWRTLHPCSVARTFLESNGVCEVSGPKDIHMPKGPTRP